LESGILLAQLLDKSQLRLTSALRSSDAMCTTGKGQTAVLLPSLGGEEEAILVAQKILDKLDQPLLLDGLRVDVCPRIGIALFPKHSVSAGMLLQCCNKALTSARRTKQSYVLYSPDQSSHERPQLRFSELRQAIVEDQLFLHYQPKVDLRTGAIAGVEALTRWQHGDHGLISPAEFIPLAERTGLIVPLTLWVLHRALVQWSNWQTMGIDTTVAINLSMWNLDALELPEQIDGLLKKTGVPPDRLELEITESAVMDDPQKTIRILNSIRDLGVQFTIDDFGTGYSSLAHLKKLPVGCIKIDKSFVQNMETDKDDAVIVRSIIDLGHNLGLRVIAEGVETSGAKEMLVEFNCDEAQGYYFGYPAVPLEITRLFHKLSPAAHASESIEHSTTDELMQLMRHVGSVSVSNMPLLHCK